MHKMDDTPKIITIIGLIMETLGIVALFVVYFILVHTVDSVWASAETIGITTEEYNGLMDFMDVIFKVYWIVGGLNVFIYLVDMFLFTKLIRGKFEDKQARKVYIYQIVIGVVFLFGNTLTGILYMVSGFQGKNGYVEMKDMREGI